jgi:hypothetical protein
MYTQSNLAFSPSSRTTFTRRGWDSLSREEQLHQIRELIGSPYWSVLPADIQERFLDDLYRS